VNLTDLPVVLPVIPLEEPLLLPGTVIPFYARDLWAYRLLEDALQCGGYVGILQPMENGRFCRPGPAGQPPLYSVGCLGRIGDCCEEEPGEFLILAEGVVRFRVAEELAPSPYGYRQVRVDYYEFLEDLFRHRDELKFPALREVVRQRLTYNEAPIDLALMDGMAGTEIVTALAHAISFSSAERQVLLETPDLRELQDVLLQLMTGVGGTVRFDQAPMLPS
jgi:Lon protease-like protein